MVLTPRIQFFRKNIKLEVSSSFKDHPQIFLSFFNPQNDQQQINNKKGGSFGSTQYDYKNGLFVKLNHNEVYQLVNWFEVRSLDEPLIQIIHKPFNKKNNYTLKIHFNRFKSSKIPNQLLYSINVEKVDNTTQQSDERKIVLKESEMRELIDFIKFSTIFGYYIIEYLRITQNNNTNNNNNYRSGETDTTNQWF